MPKHLTPNSSVANNLVKSNPTKDFHFKQFSIVGGHAGMPVSTDAILLGAWANIQASLNTSASLNLPKTHSILDIGTGTGLLALMCAQRCLNTANINVNTDVNKHLITAIDIDDSAIEAAITNIQNSSWHESINVKKQDVLQMNGEQKFDSIICNPPYFTSGNPTKNASRALARHSICLPHQSLLASCKKLLNNDGNASFILPRVEGEQFIELAKGMNWHLKRLCRVHTTESKPCHRLLIELAFKPFGLDKCETQVTDLFIHLKPDPSKSRNYNDYSDDFIELTKDFYLKM